MLFARLVAHTHRSRHLAIRAYASCKRALQARDSVVGVLERCVTAIWQDCVHSLVPSSLRRTTCKSQIPNTHAPDGKGNGEGKGRDLTSGHNPHPTPRNGERIRLPIRRRADFDHDLALVHEEAHLHLAAVLRALETLRRQFDDAGAEEGEGHDFGVLEFRPGYVAGDDAGLGECQICVYIS